ncbi:DUF2288 domain-containing protein [Gloeothece verrucosa]|uniref:DUF2288 domain-containing protein n=1 Tax=Gloeothece verrucosa (strain PCC 7822) TaxID=497965 RepID=E0U5M6_GLOV7|nr:DUF2288 domain-containing protein [Gloeothece verrucosa]ADN14739.1 Protein of unknown function DUF2288 [Gloeothece verrucosa PCC 7822]
MSDLKTQLSEQLADIEWNDLKPHAGRDALIIVANSLNLVEVAEAIALDNVPLVQEWMSQQLIYKPSAQQLMSWNEDPKKTFSALIVQPFVLACPV